MWSLTLRVPEKEPEEYILKAGQSTIGRKSDCDIVVFDSSASRLHANIYYDETADSITLSDESSTNGTFVNRERIHDARRLLDGDVIRIGGSTIDIARHVTGEESQGYSGTYRYTRELVLESVDHHAVLMYAVARKLNTVMDIDTALSEVASLMQRAMGSDRCKVLLAEDFDDMADLGFPASIAELAIERRSAIVIPIMSENPLGKSSDSGFLLGIQSALCVPVMSGEDVIALIYMYKTKIGRRPFSQNDMQLAVAISHQAALTIQRTHLLEQLRKEHRGRELLQRFLSPQEAEYMLKDYLRVGSLPGLTEAEVTILFTDIADSIALAERVGAQRFGEVLDRHYRDLTEIIFKYGGVVKYLGDGIMAVFGMLGRKDDPEEHAVRAGLEIIEHVESTDYGEGVDIQVGVAINSGSVMIGYVGTQQRVELTALGDTVNVAYRLQNFARPNRLLIGVETAVGVAGKLHLKDMGMQKIRGRTQPLMVYEVLRDGN
ncbi:MAG: FHA domain-containing protein [Chloroflexi bacterium]|nr:FHA domain-containing protein [Chloroflexota bacterium]